jgi:hypothetical protein
MRQDMSKVIVERPRFGSRLRSRKKGYRKYVQRTALDNLPRREPMLGRWRGRQKLLNEHLGPMRRFLRSQVGRPWNKVHQELCEHISFDNAVQKHVLAHVFQFVRRQVVIRDGVIYGDERTWLRRKVALKPGEMYICPRTGLLKVVRAKRQVVRPQRLQISPTVQYHWRGNAWWELRLRKLPAHTAEIWEVWFERLVEKLTEAELMAEYGGKFITVSKRLLSRSEIRQLNRLITTKRKAR